MQIEIYQGWHWMRLALLGAPILLMVIISVVSAEVVKYLRNRRR